MRCPNCGQEIAPDDRFCSNCGTRLEPAGQGETTAPGGSHAETGATGSGEPAFPTVGRRNAWEYERDRVRGDQADDEWTMSDLGPPPPRKRRTWLWIIIAILALLVLSCCVFMYWVGYTDSGQEWFSGIATEAAGIMEATEQAQATPGATPTTD